MRKQLTVRPDAAAALTRSQARGFDALRCGDEFCQEKAGDLAGLRLLKSRFPDKELVLVTPLLTGPALAGVRAAVKGMLREGLCSRLVVNDLGLLRLLAAGRKSALRVSVGRVLLSNLGHSVGSPLFKTLLAKARAESFEVDSPDGLAPLADYPGMPCDLHAPYAYLTHTRHCPFAGGFPAGCGRPCGDTAYPLRSGNEKGVFLKGNAYFRDNAADARELRKKYPGRIRSLVLPLGKGRAGGPLPEADRHDR